MAIAAYPATISIGGTIINDIMTIDLNQKMLKADTTAFSGSGGAAVGTETSIPTLFNATLKLSGSWNKPDAGQVALENAFYARTIGSVVFTVTTGKTYTAQCWVESVDTKADPKKQVDASYGLVVTGSMVVV